jgi:hypothetical protein
MTRTLTAQEAQLCKNWVKYFATKEGYQDTTRNADIIHDFIDRLYNGEYSYDNLTAAMEANRNNLDGLGVATSAAMQAEIAKREADRKAAELNRQQADHNNGVVAKFVKNHAPTALIVNGDFYPTTQDKLVAFIKNKYPGQLLSNEILRDALETLWNSLDFFDRSPESMVFRNIVKAPRVLSEQAKIDAGLKPQRDLRSHADDGKLVNPNDRLREVVKKVLGKESPDEIAANQVSVTTRYGKLDHGFTAVLRKTFVYDRTGAVNWKETKDKRMAMATEQERNRNRVGKFER